jgi:hypothetical protein
VTIVRRAAAVLVLCLAACAPGKATPPVVAPQFVAAAAPHVAPVTTAWGPAVEGLRCRVTLRTEEHAQGDVVRAAIEFDVDTATLPPGRARFDDDERTRRPALELTAADGRRIEVRPYDPYSGMLAVPTPEAEPWTDLARPESRRFDVEFPLARGWDDLATGAYRGRVRVEFTPAEPGCWRGTLVTPDFEFELCEAAPREETFLLPTALHVETSALADRDATPVRTVTYGSGEAEAVRLPRRNGFFVGTHVERDGVPFALRGGSAPVPDDPNGLDQSLGAGPDSQALGATYTIVLFETADAPQHAWIPHAGSGSYRELWRRTLPLRR